MLGDYQKKEHQIEVLADSIQKLNLKVVDSYIESLPFKNKNLVKAQYRLESNYLKSSLVRTNFNLFGMKASSRKHTYKNIKNGYANYSTWQMSVLDRLMYEIYVGTSLKGYAEDKSYFQKLNDIKL
jgi:flagellum-specific peptidoglycan hydrolase FlgJ